MYEAPMCSHGYLNIRLFKLHDKNYSDELVLLKYGIFDV